LLISCTHHVAHFCVISACFNAQSLVSH
jgi:hypothetical protein